jgi:hypothetical protein
MNAVETYRVSLENIERLRKEQLKEVNEMIESSAKIGRLYYIYRGCLYDETLNDLFLRGFKIFDDDNGYRKISWDPDDVKIK